MVKTEASARAQIGNDNFLTNQGSIGFQQYSGSGWQAAVISGSTEFQLSDFIDHGAHDLQIDANVAAGEFIQVLELSYQLIQE